MPAPAPLSGTILCQQAIVSNAKGLVPSSPTSSLSPQGWLVWGLQPLPSSPPLVGFFISVLRVLMSLDSHWISTSGSPALRPLNLYHWLSHIYTLHTAGSIGLTKKLIWVFPKDVRIFQPSLLHEPIICNKYLYICIYSIGSLFLLNPNAVYLPYFLNTWISYLFTFHHLYSTKHIVVQSLCPTLCDSINCSISDFPVLRYLPEFSQAHKY